jgi:ABC-type branched-subunit amino acid transport system substrate-binding protein
MELAASEARPSEVKLVFEDDRSVDKKATLSAARKLIDIDGVNALYSWTLSTVPALTPLVAKARIPLVIGAYDRRIAQAGEFVFGGFVNIELTAREIARYFKRRGAHRVGMVFAADDWSTSFEAPFRDEIARLGLEVVYSETIDPTETETRGIVSSLKKHKVEAVLAPLFGNSLLSFVRRHREMRAESIINVADGMFEADIQTLGAAAEGVTAMQMWVTSEELAKKMTRKFGASPNPLQLGLVASGYDAMHHVILAARAMREAGKGVTGEALNSSLKSFKSIGYLGEHMLGAAPTFAGEEAVMVQQGVYRVAP